MKEKRAKGIFCSAAFRIVFVMAVLIVPFNIWAIWSAHEVEQSIYMDCENNLKSLGQLCVKDLDAKAKAADAYLFDELLNNRFFSEVSIGNSDYKFYHAIYNLRHNIHTDANVYMRADAYFLYSLSNDYMDIITTGATGEERTQIQSMVKSALSDKNTRKTLPWLMISDGEKTWFMRLTCQKNLCYGALINIDTLYRTMLAGLDYENISAKFETQKKESLKGQICVSIYSEGTGFFMNLAIDSAQVMRNLPVIQRWGIRFSLIFIFIVPAIIGLTYHSLLHPIKILLNAMNHVRMGEQSYQIQEKANSREFTQLYDNFNTMVVAQEKLSRELVERESYSKKMELQNLQMQIRPHFLLNTFNLMYGLVTMGKIESTQKMILYLSDYFRYIFRSGKEKELYGRELELIVHYIEIARLRYPFISFCETHDERILQVPVPPLLIHNFVENVLKHGLNPDGMTNIILNAWCTEDKAVFEIEDDGRGIEEAIVRAVNSGFTEGEDMTLHVGLKNSWQRIHYVYGEYGKMHVESEPGKGTKITLELLAKEEEV